MRKVNTKKKQRKETERVQDVSNSSINEDVAKESKNGGNEGNSVAVDREKKGKKGNRERAQNESNAKENDELEEYEVEDVVDHKVDNGVSYFLIKWKGYDAESNTWEPEDTLSCPDLVSKFKKRVKARKSRSETVQRKKLKISAEDQVSTDPNQEWEVEKIIDAVDRNGVRLFRIRWKGYRPSSDTWEPEGNLNCGDLIEKFLKKHKRLELSQKELREAPRQTKRFVTGTFGRRSSKRYSGRVRTVYYDAE